jgi:hypothetical protein
MDAASLPSEIRRLLPCGYTTPGSYGLRTGWAVELNAWGASVPYKAEVFPSFHDAKTGPLWGAIWDFSAADGKNVQAYLEAKTGKKPWDDKPVAGSVLPKPLSTISKLEASFAYRLDAIGNCNVALESWLTKNVSSGPDEIVCEIMAWTESHGTCHPAGRVIDRFADQWGQQWGMYYEAPTDSRAWPYFAFYGIVPTYRRVDMLAMIRRAVEELGLAADPVVATVEVGCELFDGVGAFAMDRCEVTCE